MAEQSSDARRQELAAAIDGRSDEDIIRGVEAEGTDTVLTRIFTGMCEAFLPEKAGTQSAVLTLNVADFLRLVSSKLNGMQAFMAGKLKLGGDMMFAQIMQGWFRQP